MTTTSHQRPPGQTVSTGLVVAIVGFFGTFPIVLAGLEGVGADSSQAASGLMAAAVAMGMVAIVLGLVRREPISSAWPTAGVALLATAGIPDGGFPDAVGAFVVVGAVTLVAGLWQPLGRLAAAIPVPLAQAMLGGVLLGLCVVPFRSMVDAPGDAVPIVVTWFVVGRINRLFAVPAAVVVASVAVMFDAGFSIPLDDGVLTTPVWTTPTFDAGTIVSIGLPLFIVAMATQNVPGMAILRGYGYPPSPRLLLSSVGVASVATAPFAAPATCVSAITAAMCAGEDSHPDPALRYWSAVSGGVFYCLFGIFAAVVTSVATVAGAVVLGTLAGVALIPVLVNSVQASLQDETVREAAGITFLVTASGAEIGNFTSPVLGLAAGGIVLAAQHLRN